MVDPYRQLWRIVDGAVRDCVLSHPDYFTAKGFRSARPSIVKRVTGTVLSFATAAKGRSDPPADMPSGCGPEASRGGIAPARAAQPVGQPEIPGTTHCALVLHHLRTIGPITPWEALELYGCFRLGARIYDLKRRGHPIITELVTAAKGKRHARYHLL